MTQRILWPVVGLFVALAFGVGVGQWLLQGTYERQQRSAAERAEVVSTMALSELVSATLEGGEEEGVQEVVEAWQQRHDTFQVVRVIQGRRLVASTAAQDQGDQAAPRRLARDEKEYFDTAQRLRQAVDSNRQGSTAAKDEVEVLSLEAAGLSVAVPVELGGEIEGAVLVETEAAAELASAPSGTAWLTLVAPVLILALLGAFTPLSRRVLVAAAAVLAVIALGFFAQRSGSLVTSALTSAGETVAERMQQDAATLQELVAAQVGATTSEAVLSDAAESEAVESEDGSSEGQPEDSSEGSTPEAAEGTTETEQPADAEEPVETEQSYALAAVDPSAWDVDPQRAGRGWIDAAGAVVPSAVSEASLGVSSSLRQRLTAVGLGALLLLAFFGLGGAQRVVSDLVTFRQAYSYVGPAMIGMLILVFFPFFYGIALSFTNQSIYNTDQPITEIWTGFENYVEILSDFELYRELDGEKVLNFENFYWTLFITVLWTVTNVTIGVSVGLALALMLNTKGLAFKPIYRVILILPWAVPNYITALVWKGMFHKQFGVINQVFQIFGLEPVGWFDGVATSFLTVLATNSWLSFPFMMVISLGALQSIPADLYEAARVDGATRWRQFRSITLPMLKPALIPAVILSVIWTFNMFNIIYLVSGGEPSGSTEILITAAYKIAFEQYRYGYAAAYSTVIFGILLAYGWWQIRVTKATEAVQ
ncbi:MAG: ABC transporter permease subunit [Acidobacteriota bacterium]